MPSLPELERRLAHAVFGGDAAGVATQIARGRFPAERHLQVYRNNVFASLTEALRALYPVVERLVGDEFFRSSAHAYIRRHPPPSGNLHDFGAAFSEFLAEFPAAQPLVYLPDVARLEWFWHEAFHAAEAEPRALARLSAVPPARHGALRFRLHPSARLLASDYPILRIWQVNQPEYRGDSVVDLAEGGVRLLVMRRGLTVAIEPLGAGEHALLSAMAAGKNFAESAEAALAVEPELDLPRSLRRRVRDATLVDFVF